MRKWFPAMMLATAVWATGCAHQMKNSPNASGAADTNRQEAVDRLRDSGKVLDELMNAPDSQIPETVLAGAKCVGVVPDMVKGGFVIGGRHGRGVVTCRTAKGWSAPAFFTMSGGSWGAQIGVESVDVVMLFMNDTAVQTLLKDNFKMGADASVAAGPVGRAASADTDAKLNSQILTYSRTKGLFAGLELSGAAVRPDEDSMRGFYGRNLNFKTALAGNTPVPADATSFVDTVAKTFHEAKTDKSGM